jgi:hypothetical protein
MTCYFVIFFFAMTIKVYVKAENVIFPNHRDASPLLQNSDPSKKSKLDPL